MIRSQQEVGEVHHEKSEVGGIVLGRGEQEIGETVDCDAIAFLGPGEGEIVAAQSRFDMGERDHFISMEMASMGMELMAELGAAPVTEQERIGVGPAELAREQRDGGDTRVIDRTAHDPWLVAFELLQPLNLLDLTGVWPTRAGASMALNTGPGPRRPGPRP